MTITPRTGEGPLRVAAGLPPGNAAPADAALRAVLEATRELLWIDSPEDAVALAASLVVALGGVVVPAREAPPEAVPLDLAFGAGEPVLPVADTAGGRRLLEQHLAGFVRDAHRALELADHPRRLAEDASLDALTGLLNRRTLGRVLSRLGVEDALIMLDLDHFKAVNDTFGHAEGDRVLREFAAALRQTARAVDRLGRYGGEEFVVLVTGGDPDAFLGRLRTVWESRRPRPVSFSAGVAEARVDPVHALGAADRALYRAKAAGRDQWQRAVAEDYR